MWKRHERSLRCHNSQNRQTIPVRRQRKFISRLRTEIKTAVQLMKTPEEGKTITRVRLKLIRNGNGEIKNCTPAYIKGSKPWLGSKGRRYFTSGRPRQDTRHSRRATNAERKGANGVRVINQGLYPHDAWLECCHDSGLIIHHEWVLLYSQPTFEGGMISKSFVV